MSDVSSPGVAGDLVRIHLVITRALKVAIENSRSFAESSGHQDSSAREGFISYVLSLVSSLHAHHLTEDDIAFPYFRERITEAPFDLLAAQHREMIPWLDEIGNSAEEAVASAQASVPLWRLNLALIRINEIWCPHIKMEEEHFTLERVNALVDAEEQRRLGQLFSEHSRKHSGPDYLVVPFLLYNLPPEERALMAQAMPPIATQELVPVVWKDKWAPMRPFLLE